MAEQKLIKLKINEREVQVPQGTLVIEATRRLGTEVPSFCYYPGLTLQAACRMCLIEVEKAPKLQTACTQVVARSLELRRLLHFNQAHPASRLQRQSRVVAERRHFRSQPTRRFN